MMYAERGEMMHAETGEMMYAERGEMANAEAGPRPALPSHGGSFATERPGCHAGIPPPPPGVFGRERRVRERRPGDEAATRIRPGGRCARRPDTSRRT